MAEENAPEQLRWFSSAPDRSRSDRDAVEFVDIDLSAHIGSLVNGKNVLAIHGLNHFNDGEDMLLVAELTATTRDIATAIGAPARTGYMPSPTPGVHNVSNRDVFRGFVKETQLSVEHGFYETPFQVDIVTETPDSEVYFTVDGSVPAPSNPMATKYQSPLTIDSTTTLRAAAYRDEFLPSPPQTQTYLFLDDVIRQSPDGEAPPGWPSERVNSQEFDYGMDPEIVNDSVYGPLMKDALLDISTISIVTDRDHLFDRVTGIFVNAETARRRNDLWERPTSVELIQPDGSDDFQIDAGIRMRGGFSRRGDNPKHAFRLMFRSEYGDSKLNFPFFGEEGVDTFDNIDLRTAQVPSWSLCWPDAVNTSGGCRFNTMVREVFSRDTQGAMGQPYTRSRYHHLYLNGQYWGLFQSQERSEASFGESYLGGRRSDYDVIKVEGFPHQINATDGNLDAWRQLWDEAKKGFATNESYYRVQGLNVDETRNSEYPVLLEVENLIDYMIVIFYTGDLDSPISNFLNNNNTNNWFGIRNRNGEEGFRFFAHDAEWTLFNVRQNRLGPWPAGDTFQQSNPQWLHQQLMENEEYRLQFADRVQKHLFNGGVLTPEIALSRFQNRVDQIDLAIIAESARWGDSKRDRPFTKEDWLEAVSHITDTYIPQRTEIVLDQFNRRARLRDRTPAPLYPNIAAPVFNQHGGLILPGFQLAMEANTEVFYTIDGSDPRTAPAPIRQQYARPIALFEGAVVKARARQGGDWSALVEASFHLPPPPVRISEIMYHPSNPTEQEREVGFIDGEDFEFIELVNISDTATAPLHGFALTEGIQFEFPDISLAPGARTVVVRNRAAFQYRYGESVRISGEYGESTNGSKLDNAGERLRLVDDTAVVIQEFVFDDAWYPSTDGGGLSLELVDSAIGELDAWNRAESWLPSVTPGGSPGKANGFLPKPGDANWDGVFDQLDVVAVLQAAKFLSGAPATFEEGDWNRDGKFDQTDIVAALQTGSYLQQALDLQAFDDAFRDVAKAIEGPI